MVDAAEGAHHELLSTSASMTSVQRRAHVTPAMTQLTSGSAWGALGPPMPTKPTSTRGSVLRDAELSQPGIYQAKEALYNTLMAVSDRGCVAS